MRFGGHDQKRPPCRFGSGIIAHNSGFSLCPAPPACPNPAASSPGFPCAFRAWPPGTVQHISPRLAAIRSLSVPIWRYFRPATAGSTGHFIYRVVVVPDRSETRTVTVTATPATRTEGAMPPSPVPEAAGRVGVVVAWAWATGTATPKAQIKAKAAGARVEKNGFIFLLPGNHLQTQRPATG